jgi:voltage-gated potassium channel
MIVFGTLTVLYFYGLFSMEHYNEAEVLKDYSWWFIVTVSTVGYGDIYPTTTGGKRAAIVIIVFGVALMGLILGLIGEKVWRIMESFNNGLANLDVENHIQIMGYRGSETDKLIAEIQGDESTKNTIIVVCSDHLESNPFNHSNIKFIKGELSSEDVLTRSCAKYAQKMIIHGKKDDQSVLTALSFRHINTEAQMIVYLNNEDHKNKILKLESKYKDYNQVILPVFVNLMVQEMQDPGSSKVLQGLMSNLDQDTLFKVNVPVDLNITFLDLLFKLKQKYNITALAVENGIIALNPDNDLNIIKGMSIFYVGQTRLNSINLD